MTHNPRLRGLYVLTAQTLTPAPRLLSEVEAALRGGARLVQYRDKHSAASVRLTQAQQLRALCQRFGACFLINDDVALAQAVDADGVHLGQSDMPLPQARALLGPDKLIGITCHASLALAYQAVAQGADYLAFGAFYPSVTKPQAASAPLALLHQAKQQLSLPLCAIGGITADNATPLVAAGADLLAVTAGVFASADTQQAAAQLARLYAISA